MAKRLFIAADISDEARRFAGDVISSLRSEFPVKGVSWSKPENLHVTIKFLGDTEDDVLEELCDSLITIASTFQSFRLRLDKTELLGERVVSVAVGSDSQTVFDLEKQIDTECKPFGFECERRRFYPHLTLARIREPENSRELSGRFLQTHIEPLCFEVREIVLYESELGADGSVYRVVRRFGLETSE